MKNLFWRGVEAALYASGWLVVQIMQGLDEINDAIGSLFRRRK